MRLLLALLALFACHARAQDWYCSFEDVCKECDNSEGRCPLDISLWKSQPECARNCPEPPDCYYCDEQAGRCSPAHGLACQVSNPGYRRDNATCQANCARSSQQQPEQLRYHCQLDQCVQCSGFSCPLDKASYATMGECASNCPPAPDCYICSSENRCEPAHGPLACNINQLSVHLTLEQCSPLCEGPEQPSVPKIGSRSAVASVFLLVTCALFL